ncbi:MAG: GYD domain-containing protein [Betaproteobacteria bacterium]
MPKYLFQARYTSEGAKGVLAGGGTARRDAVDKAVASAGGKLESFYFAFGDVDAFVVADLPDDVSAAAMAMAVGASGMSSARTVKLLTPQDMDKAAKVAVAYKPPGK